MMHYRDRTFCEGNGCKKFASCPEALTDAVKRAAERWWGGPDAPISVSAEPEKKECYDNGKIQEKTGNN